MTTIVDLGEHAPVRRLCEVVGLPRATFYRVRRPEPRARAPRPRPRRALDPAEENAVLLALHEDRFVDLAPREIHAILLDEGRYLCSPRTMYRILEKRAEQIGRAHV